MNDTTKIVHPDDTPFGKVHIKRQAQRKVRCIEVPEWGTKTNPLRLYAYPLTTGEVMALEGQYPTNTEQNVMQMIRQCLDSNGDQYFSLLDKTALMNEPSELIGRVALELNGELTTFTKELKKNKG
ncbi:hypothetical protein LCGC14_2044130 [marine sediment metagenome]|uniref:Uncharacterized protein n=1 Tax=marine sediment metagenome TaxID=412755 RepID=A0A0F9EQV1_9ZZZZ